MRESIAAHMVERITVGQLGRPQGGELGRIRMQFQFGGDRLFHSISIAYFTQSVKRGSRVKLAAFLPPFVEVYCTTLVRLVELSSLEYCKIMKSIHVG